MKPKGCACYGSNDIHECYCNLKNNNMKNVHLLPTENPSSLFEIDGHLIINKEQLIQPKYYRNIYITSDEEIKEGDWYYYFGHIVKYDSDENTLTPNCKKIILTDNEDLIKDGVQAIDNEFLEWFVKNPSCEWIEVIKIDVEQPKPLYPNGNHKGERVWIEQYKIIIPQEEPKQETLEEAAERIYDDNLFDYKKYRDGFIQGAKWQQKRMYSEEDIMNALHSVELKDNKDYSKIYNGMKDWFEQFKNK
jgi:hypothetical protein